MFSFDHFTRSIQIIIFNITLYGLLNMTIEHENTLINCQDIKWKILYNRDIQIAVLSHNT
jgi:hypothetical protein